MQASPASCNAQLGGSKQIVLFRCQSMRLPYADATNANFTSSFTHDKSVVILNVQHVSPTGSPGFKSVRIFVIKVVSRNHT